MVLAMAVIGSLFFLRGKIPHERFDTARWKEGVNTEATSTLRWDMMNSLRMKHRLKGMSKTEILELLGPPDSERTGEFYYFLGFSQNGINTGGLRLYFNENETVVHFLVSEG
jgi:hypothetical protein